VCHSVLQMAVLLTLPSSAQPGMMRQLPKCCVWQKRRHVCRLPARQLLAVSHHSHWLPTLCSAGTANLAQHSCLHRAFAYAGRNGSPRRWGGDQWTSMVHVSVCLRLCYWIDAQQLENRQRWIGNCNWVVLMSQFQCTAAPQMLSSKRGQRAPVWMGAMCKDGPGAGDFDYHPSPRLLHATSGEGHAFCHLLSVSSAAALAELPNYSFLCHRVISLLFILPRL